MVPMVPTAPDSAVAADVCWAAPSVVLCVSVVFLALSSNARRGVRIRRRHHGDTEDHGEGNNLAYSPGFPLPTFWLFIRGGSWSSSAISSGSMELGPGFHQARMSLVKRIISAVASAWTSRPFSTARPSPALLAAVPTTPPASD